MGGLCVSMLYEPLIKKLMGQYDLQIEMLHQMNPDMLRLVSMLNPSTGHINAPLKPKKTLPTKKFLIPMIRLKSTPTYPIWGRQRKF